MIKRAFTEHPASVGESYFEHMAMALRFGARMLLGGLACLVHAFFPFLFIRTGSECIDNLHERMVTNRDRRKHAETAAQMPALPRDDGANLTAAE